MASKSKIEWCNATWNPWRGCQKISSGCDNCYMFKDQRRYGLDPSLVTRSKTTFNDPLKWKDSKLIFTCSWSDFFIQEADQWRDEVWEIIRNTKHHTYQILTKRPHRIEKHIPSDWPLQNVWLGVTVENKRQGLPRIDTLREIPASVRFLSVEPLLEDLGDINLTGIDWVIVGGESGPKARPLNPQWVRNIRDQCLDASIPFFFKQWGGKNKKEAGRIIDRRTWDQMPKKRKKQ